MMHGQENIKLDIRLFYILKLRMHYSVFPP